MARFTENQQNAIDKAGNLIVSASAGSGKTTVMIERVAKLILSGTDIRKIVVMTFTKASANDMKEKLIKKLNEKIVTRQGDLTFLKQQIKLINLSNISTIDSFCAKIYNTYFEAIGKLPNLNVVADMEKERLLNLAIDEMLEYFLGQNDSVAMSILEYFTKNRSLDKFRKTLIYINNFVSVQPDSKAFLEELCKPKLEEIKKYLLSSVRKKLRSLEVEAEIIQNELSTYDLTKEYDLNAILLVNLKMFGEVKDIYEFSAALNKITEISYRKNSAKKTLEQIAACDRFQTNKDRAKNYFDKLKTDYCEIEDKLLRDKKSREINQKFILMAEYFLNAYERIKEEENLIDYADIEHYALKILQDPERQAKIKETFDYVFIDEYQDTNYLQEEILKCISRADNLFMVGDSKQAIYKFRFAEPKIFLDRYYNYQNKIGGESEVLNDNFRSSKQILDFINSIFNQIMTLDFGQLDYANTAQLISGMDYPDYNEGKNIEVAFFDKTRAAIDKLDFKNFYSVKKDKREQDFDKESIYIADKVEELVGKKFIYDIKKADKRLIKYSDIAILTRTKKANEILTELARRSIPVYSNGYINKSNATLELVINFLKIIDNSNNDVALIDVLVSFIGDFSDNELLKIRYAYTETRTPFYLAFNNYCKEDSIKKKIDKFKEALRKYKKQSAYLTVQSLLSNILIDMNFEKEISARKNSREELFDLRSYINSLEDKESATELSLFLHNLDLTEREMVNIADSEDAITITTVHKSKGLEFPIVFVSQMESKFSTDYNKKPIMADKDFGVAFNFFDEQLKTNEHTFSNNVFKIKNEAEEKASILRLLYVAFTRARYMLFISGYKGKNIVSDVEDANCFLDWIQFAQEKDNSTKIYNVMREGVPLNQNLEERKFYYKINDIKREEYKFGEETTFSTKFYASAVKESLTLSESEEDLSIDYELNKHDKYTKANKRVSITSDLGTLYHKIMQKIDFNIVEPSKIYEAIDKIIEGDLLAEQIDKEYIVKVLQNPFFDEIKSKKLVREQEFVLYAKANELFDTTATDKILIQGAVDLLVLDDEPILVDYKVSLKDVDYLKKMYKTQLNLYAYAIEKILKIKLKRKLLFIINKNIIVEM